MKIKPLILTLLLGLAAFTAQAQTAAINGVDRDGFGGVYEIAGSNFDGGNYWWMCIEPNGSNSAGVGDGFIADALSFLGGWDQQNQERLDFYTNNPGYYTTAIPTQVRVMEYVLDTYLPWNLTGPTGRFLEQGFSSANYGTNVDFYNAFFTIQNFISEAYGKSTKDDFTDLSDFAFFAGNATGDVDATAARLALFNSILSDVETKAAANFFDSYTALGTYIIANTLFSETDTVNNRQDALIIVAPVPEPSGALLIACAGIVVMLRRFRRLA